MPVNTAIILQELNLSIFFWLPAFVLLASPVATPGSSSHYHRDNEIPGIKFLRLY